MAGRGGVRWRESLDMGLGPQYYTPHTHMHTHMLTHTYGGEGRHRYHV